jgi:beta-lactamase class A
MGILVPRDRNGKRYPYIVVGVIQRDSRPKNYGNWMLTRGNVIRQVSTLVYEEMKRQYRLL